MGAKVWRGWGKSMARHWFGSGATLGPVQHWVRPAMGKQAGYGLKGGTCLLFEEIGDIG